MTSRRLVAVLLVVAGLVTTVMAVRRQRLDVATADFVRRYGPA